MATGDERHTGAQAIVKVPNGNPIPVSNVSWDTDVNQTEVQHSNDGGPGNPLKATRAITGLRYSGSFEYDGKNEDLRARLFQDDGTPVRFTMTVKEQGSDDGEITRTTTFEEVFVTSMSRDVPSDDVSSTTVDWAAEDKYTVLQS